MKALPKLPRFSLLLAALAMPTASQATLIAIDLTQVTIESGSNSGDSTWAWGGGDPAFFDLEFSSGNGSHIDLDGGALQGNEYYSGAEPVGNHVYDVINATFLGGGNWQIDAVRGANTYSLGTVTEYTGALSHAANYDYFGSESHPVNGPSDAGANSATPSTSKGWFWIYRSTANDTVSLNIVTGSGATGGNDGGGFRAEFSFSNYLGAPAILVDNDGNIQLSGSTFTGSWTWDSTHDDGGVLGGVQTIAIPEPGASVLAGVALSMLALRRGRRS